MIILRFPIRDKLQTTSLAVVDAYNTKGEKKGKKIVISFKLGRELWAHHLGDHTAMCK